MFTSASTTTPRSSSEAISSAEAFAFDRSFGTTVTSTPSRSSTSRAIASIAAPLRATMTTPHPSAPNRRVNSTPNPPEAPVTSAVGRVAPALIRP